MQPEIKGSGLQFKEAIDFFRQKMNVPTRRWNDIWQGAHARAFMVAGAMKADLLTDLRGAVDQAVTGGSFRNFQKDFDAIVDKHGWNYNGGRDWRTRVIYRTNMRAAYQAGRYRQMTDPDVLRHRPFWEYVHGDSQHPRPEHLAWDGLVLAADDPWWQTHYTPNGWGCSCRIRSLSRRQLARLGKDGPDQAPPVELVNWTDKATGETRRVPKGIDPGFGHNIGEAAFGRSLAHSVIEKLRGGRWKAIEGKSPADYGRGAVPIDKPKAKSGPRAQKPEDFEDLFFRAIGGETVRLVDAAGDGIVLDKTLAAHLAEGRLDGREQYLPFIKELVEDPYEIWAAFAVNELTGQYGIRRKYVKNIALRRGKSVHLVAETVNGVWVALTFFPSSRVMQSIRNGVLVYGRKEKGGT